MSTSASAPVSSAERLEKLEKEHRNLLARLERLEKRGGSIFFEVLRTAVLLIVVGLVLHYLGYLPGNLERLPLVARSVNAGTLEGDEVMAGEVILRDRSGTSRARLAIEEDGPALTFFDKHGRPTQTIPPGGKP